MGTIEKTEKIVR